MSKRIFHIQVMLHDLMPGWVVGGITGNHRAFSKQDTGLIRPCQLVAISLAVVRG